MKGRRGRAVAAALAAALVAVMPVPGSAQSAEPTLRLFAPSGRVKLVKYERRAPRLYEGVFVGAQNGAFEVRLTRPDYTQPIRAEQVVRTPAGTTVRPLPDDLAFDWYGMKDFFIVEVRDSSGTVVLTKTPSFCPNAEDRQRTGDAGPDVATYPAGCYGQPFTKGFVWGIDEEWAVNPFSWAGPRLKLADGTYAVTVAVAPAFRDAFAIPEENASASFELVVKTRRRCERCFPVVVDRDEPEAGASRSVPTLENPDPATLPDLEALPAWGIGVSTRRSRELLRFGATTWVGGASSLVVEGFRRQDSDVMDAYQYFYDGGEPVGRAPVGTLEYDRRRGHGHWHFLQFVGYRLLDAEMNEAVRSTKEAFCLAPTDAIDLSLDNAVWNTGDLGLYTSCGSRSSIWIRETLPLGWGDTYFQGLPGQAFDITGLPNGTYYIEVEANPGGLLHEQRSDNNVELREVILKGKPGARRVVVPPWNGIDTERGYFRYRPRH